MKLKSDIRVWPSPLGCPRPTARGWSTEVSSYTGEQPQRFTAQPHPRWKPQQGLLRKAWSTDMGPFLSNCIFSDHSLLLCKVQVWSVMESLFSTLSAALMLLKMLLNPFIFGSTGYNYFSLSSSRPRSEQTLRWQGTELFRYFFPDQPADFPN